MKRFLCILRNLDRRCYSKLGSILFLGSIVVIGIIILNKGTIMSASSYDGEIFKNEYESLNNKLSDGENKYPKVNITFENIKYISITEALNMLTPGIGMEGTGAIYIGYAECVYCRSAVQVLVDTARESAIDKIYYLDISEVWDEKEVNFDGDVVTNQEPHADYYKFVERLGNEYTKEYIIYDKDGNEVKINTRRVEAPLVIFVVDGKIVSSNVGTLFSQEDPYTPLNDDQVAGLSEIYGYGLRDVVEGIDYFKSLELERKNSQQ